MDPAHVLSTSPPWFLPTKTLPPRERRFGGHERRRASVGKKPAGVRHVAAPGAMLRPQLSAANGWHEKPGLHVHLFEKSKV